MIVEKEFLNKLKDFGLNSYESKLWTALLSRGTSTAGELSNIANVPRSRSYDVLESLERKGFIMVKIGKPIQYIAVPPEEVIDRVKKKVKNDASKQVDLLNELKISETLKELSSLHNNGIEMIEPSELSGIVKGLPNVENHVETMLRTAKKNVFITSTSKGIERKYNTYSKTLENMKSKGIDINFVTNISKINKKLKSSLELIGELTNNDSSIMRMVIVDEKQAAFMLHNDENVHPSYDTCIWINSNFFAKGLINLFSK